MAAKLGLVPGAGDDKKDKDQTGDSLERFELDDISARPELDWLVRDEAGQSEKTGEFKIQLKPQKGRSAICVLMQKAPGEKKLAQKLQIVVKPPLLAADGMAILKHLAADYLAGVLPLDALKPRKAHFLAAFQGGPEKVLEIFEKERDVNDQPNSDFINLYKMRISLAAQPAPVPFTIDAAAAPSTSSGHLVAMCVFDFGVKKE